MEDLLKLLSIPSYTGFTNAMYNHLREVTISRGYRTRNDKAWNLYATKGEAETYPCVVAHMDTVHRIEDGGIEPVIIDGNITGINPLTMRQTGIGGDDKCGIWAALHCLQVLPACKAVFFVDEERGCIGSGLCDIAFFNDCRFILQADRRGSSDFVTDIDGSLSSRAFQEAVAPIMDRFGFEESDGAMTDVKELRDRRVGVSVANMSAGYHHPHFDSEYINVLQLINTCEFMEAVCKEVTDTFLFMRPLPQPKKQEKNPVLKAVQTTMSKLSKEERDKLGDAGDREAFPDWEPYGGWADTGNGSHNNGNGQSLGQSMMRCVYCNSLYLPMELMRVNPDPICIDCEIHKDEHGVYPVAETSGIWRKLMMAGRQGKRKRGKKGRWNKH